MIKRKFIILVITALGFLLVNTLLYTASNMRRMNISNVFYSQEEVKIDSLFLHVDSTRNAKNICALPVYDFWHDSIRQQMTGWNPMKNCDKNYEKWTVLTNSTWRIVKEGANCSARCFEGVGDTRDVMFQNWIPPGHVDCEFLEAVCWQDGYEVYGYIHTQIISKTLDPPKFRFADPPNVFVFTIDSMNTGMAKRSMPNFIHHFQSRMKAIEFPFVNKVGENSQPNGFALWFGKTIEKGWSVTGEEIKPDWNFTEFCETYLDDSAHIFKEFKEYGYTTFLMEDWLNSIVDSNPFCKGLKHSPVDHLFRPFASLIEKTGMEITKHHLDGQFCREVHHSVLESLKQSMEIYKDRPLFAWMWLDLAHDYIDGPMRIDDYLVAFFEKHQKLFDNSFVILNADHGFRLGRSDTEIELFERNNPYLAISIPRKLRDAKFGILEIMGDNSKQLQTHFDTRATLLDILKYQPETQYMDRQLVKIPNEKGHSLIRRQPDFPRTCSTLPIPQQYCICQVEKFEIRNETLKTHLGQKLLDHVHHLLAESNFTSICEKFKINKITKLIEYGYTQKRKNFQIAIKTNYAHFETMITYENSTDSASFQKVVRLDSYGKTADCTNDVRHEPLCYCKNQSFLTSFNLL